MEYQVYDKFEYKYIKLYLNTLEDKLNAFGQEGWEVISLNKFESEHLTIRVLMKRKLECTNIITE